MKQSTTKVHAKPSYAFVQYKGNPDKGIFQKILGAPALENLPLELVIERTYRPEKIKADSILRDVDYHKGNNKFFTGLRTTPIANYFTGNIKEKDGKRSQVIICIEPDLSELLIWYYPKFTFYPKLLLREVNRVSKMNPK
jgi:hypothetical protein